MVSELSLNRLVRDKNLCLQEVAVYIVSGFTSDAGLYFRPLSFMSGDGFPSHDVTFHHMTLTYITICPSSLQLPKLGTSH